MIDGKREKTRKENSQWNKADSAFMWLCFWKPLWTRGVCVLFCAELNRQYLQGLNIYLACSFPTGHEISGILWNLERCMHERKCQNLITFDKLCGWIRESYTFIVLDGFQPSCSEDRLLTFFRQTAMTNQEGITPFGHVSAATTVGKIMCVKIYLHF